MSQEDEELFGLFADTLEINDDEDDIIKGSSRRANQAEIKKMCNFIGGFENWQLLIDDCKQKVIEFLDYKTVLSLSFCSKADYEIVNKTPMFVHSIEIFDNEKYHYQFEKEDFDNVRVQVQFHHDFNSGLRFERVFSQHGEDTKIRWSVPRKRDVKELILKNSNYYQEAVKYAEHWMKRSNFGLRRIKVEMEKYPMENSDIKSLPKCTDVRIGADSEDTFRWWLQKVPAQLDDLELLTNFAERHDFLISREFLSLPQIMNVRKFYFYCRADFSDEQLLNLKATRISFDAASITDDGINEFVKKWVNGKGVKGFSQALLWKEREYDTSRIIRGLEVRPWDEAFEEEAMGFCGDFHRCCGRGRTFQITSKIDLYESLTLDISSDRVSIYHTGTKYVWSGKAQTSYGIP